MAGNDWINGYLEAILDTGTHAIEDESNKVNQGKAEQRSQGLVGFNATKYFVEEVVSGVNEVDIHQTWMKATVTKNSKERSARLENLCWRIWHISRKKKEIEFNNAQRAERRALTVTEEEVLMDATDDTLDELQEPDVITNGSLISGPGSLDGEKYPCGQHNEKRLYIVLISLHGLVRGENMELGRDSDTGGQVKYVVELARALAGMPEVYRVDLLTRQICADWATTEGYSEPCEMISRGSYGCCEDVVGDSSGAYIVRIPCGPRNEYLRKELLWPYIQEFVDGSLEHISNMADILGTQIMGGEGDLVWPYVIHGHYADAGNIAALLSGALDVPMVLTGHSLGRNKLEQLLKQGKQSREDINRTYKIWRRIEAEEFSLDAAELVITSTRQEIEEQWGLYDGFSLSTLKKLLKVGKSVQGDTIIGRHMPQMAVIPPGMDFSCLDQEPNDPTDLDVDSDPSPASPRHDPPIWTEILRFFTNPHKPMILALARPDPKKNLVKLLKAFGESRALRELANLTLIMGNRDDIDTMSEASSNILTTVLKQIDKYDLYGQVAYPKHHKQTDVPDIYRLAAKTKGVFINPALVEPFGLTLIEAAAHGLPTVATMNGGPVDIQKTLNNGVLVDPHDEQAIVNALYELVADRSTWMECRRNGLKNIHLYSWPEHCRRYMRKLNVCRKKHPRWQNNLSNQSTLEDDSQDSLKDSLRDEQEMSVADDGDYCASLDNTERMNAEIELHKAKKAAREKFSSSLKLQTNTNFPALKNRKKRLVVIAVDVYNSDDPNRAKMVSVIKQVFKATKGDQNGEPGYVLATAMTAAETTSMLSGGGIQATEFDALICNSGGALYYPSTTRLEPDADYHYHIENNWTTAFIRSLASLKHPPIPEEDRSTPHCVAYIPNPDVATSIEQYRQFLRTRAFRTHVISCMNNIKLHFIPVLASRSQALRYFFVRWKIPLTSMKVFVGENGDSDYEQLLRGAHQTFLVKCADTNEPSIAELNLP